jgi:hypothetical protein
MSFSPSFKEFRHNVGFIPLREVWSEAWSAAAVSLIFYGISLVFTLPFTAIKGFVSKTYDLPTRAIGYGLACLYLIWLFKNRKYIFSELEEVFRELKEAPAWVVVLLSTVVAIGWASSEWLPVWLSTGVWIGLFFFLMFIEHLDRLGKEHTPAPEEEAYKLTS